MIRGEWKGLTSFTVILLIFSASFVIGIGAAVASPSASINPMVTSDLVQGDVFQVTVDVNSDVYDLMALNMNLYYDSSALQVNSIIENGLLGSSILTVPGSGDDGAGMILYGIASTAGTYSPESGTFVTIEFKVKTTAADGTYNLNLENVVLKDGAEANIPGVAVTNGRVAVGTAFADPTVEVDPLASGDDSNNLETSNDLETTTITDPETDDESSSASTESADTTLKSVTTTQSPDNSAEEVPASEAGSSMFAIVIGVIVIVSYKLKEN